jgi:putative ABC transport system substrate-binding protein
LVRRRSFIKVMGGSIVAWPLAALAQQSKAPVVGFLSVRSADDSISAVAAFRAGLKETGYVDGQNVTIAFRWGEGRYDRLQALAADLVALPASVIVGFGPAPALAAKSLTKTIPIVFTSSADPVESGLVPALNRPVGNVTGVSLLAVQIEAKRIELLHEVLPKANLIGFLVNPNYPTADAQVKDLQEAAQKLGLRAYVAPVRDTEAFDDVFAKLVSAKVEALMIPGDAFFTSQRRRIVAFAASQKLPAIYPWGEYVSEGGLMSYGISIDDGFRLAGVYAGKILSGAKPVDLPVQQPTKLELSINLKTARALDLAISRELQLRADEIIE